MMDDIHKSKGEFSCAENSLISGFIMGMGI